MKRGSFLVSLPGIPSLPFFFKKKKSDEKVGKPSLKKKKGLPSTTAGYSFS